MKKVITNKRAVLSRLIYKLNEFTYIEILKLYITEVDSILVDGLQTAKQYLEELRELGVLRFSNGVYKVTSYSEKRYA